MATPASLKVLSGGNSAAEVNCSPATIAAISARTVRRSQRCRVAGPFARTLGRMNIDRTPSGETNDDEDTYAAAPPRFHSHRRTGRADRPHLGGPARHHPG